MNGLCFMLTDWPPIILVVTSQRAYSVFIAIAIARCINEYVLYVAEINCENNLHKGLTRYVQNGRFCVHFY